MNTVPDSFTGILSYDTGIFMTEPEHLRHKLGVEIRNLEGLKFRAMREDEKEKSSEEKRTLNSTLPSAAIESDPKQGDIATLQWPMIFGEACILNPTEGLSRGSIIADTACDIFMLHKSQLQTFEVDDDMLERVKIKSVRYPEDPDIVVSLHRQQEWTLYKKEVMDNIPKDRWPTKLVEYEPFKTY
jgi:hypothetical protein